MKSLVGRSSLKALTSREVEILKLVFSGQTSKQIGLSLGISSRTVDVHRANVMRKLDVTSTAQLADVVLRVQREMEQELITSEAHLQESQRIAQLGSWSLDVATGLNTWSDEMFRIFGYQPKAVIPSYDLFFSHLLHEDHERVRKAVALALRGEAEYNLEYKIVRGDGAIRTIAAKGSVSRNENSQPVSMIGTALDITDYRRNQHALVASEAKFSMVLNATPFAIAISRLADATFIEANEAYLDMLGYARQELIGRSAKELKLWAKPRLLKSIHDKLSSGQSASSLDLEHRTKSGEVCIRQTTFKLYDLDGERYVIQFVSNPLMAENA